MWPGLDGDAPHGAPWAGGRKTATDVIVTISRGYGAAGLAVADGVAGALGYELLTDDIPKTVAARLGTSSDEVKSRATSEPSFGERMLRGLSEGTAEAVSPAAPRLPGDFDESVRREIERTILERAERGDVVILGRNAGALLGVRPDVLRVFLRADRAWRVERLVEAFGLSPGDAQADIERMDTARKNFAKERYNLRFGDARSYDVVIDVSRVGIAGATATVVAAVLNFGRSGAP